ncbi:TlpA family protein disulfide reductase [Gluconobacter cerinus]
MITTAALNEKLGHLSASSAARNTSSKRPKRGCIKPIALALFGLALFAKPALAAPFFANKDDNHHTLLGVYNLVVEDKDNHTRGNLANLMSFNKGTNSAVQLAGFYKGKALLVNFWAYWCSNCIAEMQSLEKLQDSIGKDKLEVILVSRPENEQKDREMARRLNLPFPLYVVSGQNSPDEIRAAYHDHGVLSLPQTWVFDSYGIASYFQAGGIDWKSKITEITNIVNHPG